ncbi:MAG: hypothetical protein ACLT98_13920 [Eggerthellaceae bacterium]
MVALQYWGETSTSSTAGLRCSSFPILAFTNSKWVESIRSSG